MFDQYDVLFEQHLYILIKKVNKKIADGWEPAGGLTIATSGDGLPYYYQAIKRLGEQ